VLGQFRPPRPLLAVLQGESLLNDATAILIYRAAVAAATGAFVLASDTPLLVLLAIASVGAGFALAWLYELATRPIRDAASSTILQFAGVFGIWLLAERIGLSAIITMVVYAMTLARRAPRRTSPRNRVSSYSVWETVVFVLNVLAFLIMGLQARPIMERLSGESLSQALVLAFAVLVTVIVVRLAWVFAYGALARTLRFGSEAVPDRRADALIGWCGMRGLVTLATAFALPQDFPGRDPIVLSAFLVVLGTLVLQGLTLKPLLTLLRFDPDHSVEDDVSRGRIVIMEAALASLEGDESLAAQVLRKQYSAARHVAKNAEAPQAASDFDEVRLRAIARQRQALIRLREDGTIGDEAYHRLEEEIDWAELDAAPAGRFQPLTTG
jgi:monovalent cation/hydrogen antiporter